MAPVAQRHPETSYRITPPDGAPYDDVLYEKHARIFDGFHYALRGVEVAEPPSYWGWDYRGSVYLAVLHLIVWHPAWTFQATATRFPGGPELMLRRLSREPSKAEWQSIQRAWRILRTFRQETRGQKALANKGDPHRRETAALAVKKWQANPHLTLTGVAYQCTMVGRERTLDRWIKTFFPDFQPPT